MTGRLHAQRLAGDQLRAQCARFLLLEVKEGRWSKQSAMKKVVVTDHVFASLDPEREVLSALPAQLVEADASSRDQLLAQVADADGILNCYYRPVDRELLEAAPRCLVVARYGIGVDTIDVAAATDLGLIVANVPSYCVEEVADHTIALLLACARKIVRLDGIVRGGVWDHKGVGAIHRLRGRVLGLIGFGKIARRVAVRAQALGLVVRCHDPVVAPAECERLAVESTGLPSVLADSDFVSLHVPLNDETRHMIGERELAAMKPTAYLINTARGALVDSAALRAALETGQIAGAGIDLLDETTPFDPDDPLLRLPNLVITPHAAWYSVEAVTELQRTAAEEVARVLRGERPLSMVNPEVWERARVNR